MLTGAAIARYDGGGPAALAHRRPRPQRKRTLGPPRPPLGPKPLPPPSPLAIKGESEGEKKNLAFLGFLGLATGFQSAFASPPRRLPPSLRAYSIHRIHRC